MKKHPLYSESKIAMNKIRGRAMRAPTYCGYHFAVFHIVVGAAIGRPQNLRFVIVGSLEKRGRIFKLTDYTTKNPEHRKICIRGKNKHFRGTTRFQLLLTQKPLKPLTRPQLITPPHAFT